ncbi:hypothetical protein pEaSNUABM34_00128 [Erwinia phage pEa_SNUABM_34]|nr:hypothetical protein pEaSNUABM34_00128 [Erwinia phage pEa_SNUABM_34]QYW05485.1 hypothetical protein pEaSNUABM25_00129 [Erwinia phage pEa_SNUABM_25]
MRSVLRHPMEFAYLENGVPRVINTEVLFQFPYGQMNRVKHVLGNINMQRHNLFVINDEEYEYSDGRLDTDFISWAVYDRLLTAIPRVDKDPNNRSCICCALAAYFDRSMRAWLRNCPEVCEFITIDVVAADHIDQHFLNDNSQEMGTGFYEASVFVLEYGTRSWKEFGVFFTDDKRYDGHTLVLYEDKTNNLSASNCKLITKQIDSADMAGYALADFSKKFGLYKSLMTIKGA